MTNPMAQYRTSNVLDVNSDLGNDLINSLLGLLKGNSDIAGKGNQVGIPKRNDSKYSSVSNQVNSESPSLSMDGNNPYLQALEEGNQRNQNVTNTSSANTSPLNTGDSGQQQNNASISLDDFMNKLFGKSSQMQNDNIAALQGDRENIAKYGRDAMRLNDQLLTGQKGLDSDIRRTESLDSFTFGINNKNQDYENTKGLNKQQMLDNENQRKYNLAEAGLRGINDIYINGMPQNHLVGLMRN
jgi:hypothetical protein